MRLRPSTIALILTPTLGAQEPPTIRVPVRLVTVPTLVFSSDNRPIPGLRQSDFPAPR
jgi:hypothetical protein